LIYSHFSKEAVSVGSLDRLAGRISKNTMKMDDEFLADISRWREKLAGSIADLNQNLNADELNESVHRILNRLIFLRTHFSEHISVEDGLIRTFIREICYPESPFQFDVIEPEILGHIYERFLGSKICIIGKNQVVVEEKIEVRFFCLLTPRNKFQG
jgi:hypothetical protein